MTEISEAAKRVVERIQGVRWALDSRVGRHTTSKIIQFAIDEATEELRAEIAMLRAMNPGVGTFPPPPKIVPTFTSGGTVAEQENTNGE